MKLTFIKAIKIFNLLNEATLGLQEVQHAYVQARLIVLSQKELAQEQNLTNAEEMKRTHLFLLFKVHVMALGHLH